MSDPKSFLERWSRQKLESAEEPALADKAALPAAEKRAGEPAAPAKPAPVAEIDLEKLPSIESIVAGTDIRAFLQKGVPPALSRAALRRAWSADPAIRDFIGLSENSWDFTAPDSMPGFGPLGPDEIRRLTAQLFGKPGEAEAAAHSSLDRSSLVQTASLPEESQDVSLHEMRDAACDESGSTRPAQVQDMKNSDKNADVTGPDKQLTIDGAAQYREQDHENDSSSSRRRHGGALPE